MTTTNKRPVAEVVVRRVSDIGPELRSIRLDRRETQTHLAKAAGVSRQWLNAFEMGDKASAPLTLVHAISSLLGVTLRIEPPARATHTHPSPAVDLNKLVDNWED
jgi:DNA-binding XRE family transcriptional regulator